MAAASTASRTKASSNKAALLASCVPGPPCWRALCPPAAVSLATTTSRGRSGPEYLPVVLVRDDDDDESSAGTTTETRMLVRVSDLKEPCMAALLEAAEEQFGYGQQGVLKPQGPL